MPRVFTLLLLLCTSPVLAQGLRVEARVYRQPDDAAQKEQLLSSSVTLMQHGKAWDYVESADEVICFEPAGNRFTILNMARELKTNVQFDEVRQLLQLRRKESARYIRDLRDSGDSAVERVSRSLTFQLNPAFDTRFDANDGVLQLKSASWNYAAKTHAWEDPDQLEAYLNYADWISRLNYVLHPSSLFPEPRLKLNEALRSHQRLPTVITLDLRPDDPVRLRAEYKFVLNMNDADRRLIRTWESFADGNDLRDMSFLRYQQAILVSQR